MVETSGSRHCQQHSPWESSTFRNCMISPIELRQHECLPASVNPPYKGSANLGLNGSVFHGFPERRLMQEANGLMGKPWLQPQTPFLAPHGYPKEPNPLFSTRAGVRPPAYGSPSCPQQKRFLIFDKSGDETRLFFSPLCPRVQNLTTTQTKCPAWDPLGAPARFFGADQLPVETQVNKVQQVWVKVPTFNEESGENEVVEEGSGIREDTEEINDLLYCGFDDDDGSDSNCDEADDELSTGHSPLAFGQDCMKLKEQGKKDFDEVDSFGISSKRQKTLDGAPKELSLLHATAMSRGNLSYENICGEDMKCDLDEEPNPTIGKKRLRKEKIRDTLRALESIIPGVKSKNPLIILDEAINYLKWLKYDAQDMSMENPDGSSCYGPSN